MTLSDAMNGRLGEWRGLPAGQTVADVGRGIGGLTGIREAAPAQRGSHRFMVSVFERAEAPHEVEAWVAVGSDRVAMVEVDEPTVVELEATLRRLGSPDLVLSDRRFLADATVRDYVYARRGLALSVAEPFTPAPDRPARAVHLQLFGATTPEVYLTDIDRGDELSPATHPLPEEERP